jgi:hypothetical protein
VPGPKMFEGTQYLELSVYALTEGTREYCLHWQENIEAMQSTQQDVRDFRRLPAAQ